MALARHRDAGVLKGRTSVCHDRDGDGVLKSRLPAPTLPAPWPLRGSMSKPKASASDVARDYKYTQEISQMVRL